jgi:hypothetical protein
MGYRKYWMFIAAFMAVGFVCLMLLDKILAMLNL